MALTLTYDSVEDNHTLKTLASRRFKLMFGSFDYGATCGGGVSMDIFAGRVRGCVILPKNGYVYSYQAGTVKAYEIGALTVNGTTSTTAEAMTAAVTGTAMTTATSLDYLAWGYE